MAASIPALVEPPMLVWAREQAGYSPEQVASKLKQPLQKLAAWERGETKPTLRQAEHLAAIYRRPFTLFYLKTPPVTVPLASEYRRLPGVTPGKESPELRVALRDLRRRRDIALELMEENEETLPRFTLAARLGEAPESVGARLRDALGVTLEIQRKWRDAYAAWRVWRDQAEALGLLVFQVPGVPLAEMRGVGLFLDPLSVVGVNSHEHVASRSFTLLHEIAHLMLQQAGDERSAAEEAFSSQRVGDLERFADAVAAAALMPRDALLSERLIREHGPSPNWATDDIVTLARRYRVSPVAMLTRILTLRLTSWDVYRQWRAAWEQQWETRPKGESSGGPSRVETILSRVGPSFAALILDSLERDQISPLAAAEALDLKLHHFADLKRELILRPRT
jgi:Zn-dependent peptidase ImmA (M78 family)/DNA-binding XRE family transcriptional regulator